MESTSETPSAPVCARCHGAGYYVLDVPVHDPNFGKLMTCDCHQTLRDQRDSEERRRLSNLNAFATKTFATFDAHVPGTKAAYQAGLDYAQGGFQGWMVLLGSCGSGKTHLAAAIANAALDRNLSVIFTVVPDLLDHLRSTFGPTSDIAYDERFETVREVPLLILDDLGTENTTPWAREKLYQLVNHRYNYRLSTILTSNREPKEIEPRIFSRMCDRTLSDVIPLSAADYRLPPTHQRERNRQRR